MFPKTFKATIGQRLALWGAVLGFIALLYGAMDFINSRRLADFAAVLQAQGSATVGLNAVDAAFERLTPAVARGSAFPSLRDTDVAAIQTALKELSQGVLGEEVRRLSMELSNDFERFVRGADSGDPSVRYLFTTAAAKRAELSAALGQAVSAASQQFAAHVVNTRRNSTLISVLGFFALTQMLLLEYRWLVKPLTHMANTLHQGDDSRAVKSAAMRRDEIGSLARALLHQFQAERQRQQESQKQVNVLSGELERQDAFKRATLDFQERIAGITRTLESNLMRMKDASGTLSQLSASMDEQASEAADATQRASDHVDEVAQSISQISSILTNTTLEAQRTSRIAESSKQLVLAASEDAQGLAQAVDAIERVVNLIGDVASKTNLLALNATIEAARAGEAGRGFAVVASEVKALASQTARATDDVRVGLESITVAASRMSERVRTLVSSVDEVDAAASTIADLMARQEEASRVISSSTTKTAIDVRSVSEKVEFVAGMVEEALRAVHTVTQASSDLDARTGDLRLAVDGLVQSNDRRIA